MAADRSRAEGRGLQMSVRVLGWPLHTVTDAFVAPSALVGIHGPLFYPSAGEDWNDPVRLFFPAVREFWFVDPRYFVESERADGSEPALNGNADFKFERFELSGPPTARRETRVGADGREYPYLEPCTRTEYYRHHTTNESLVLHRRRGYGQRSIEKVPNIGVFFHRGDSRGEGGSNVYWLSNHWVPHWLGRLPDGGLVATDGSLAQCRQLRRFHRSNTTPTEAFHQSAPFTKWGRRWTCVGWADRRYGPTLIWQLSAS